MRIFELTKRFPRIEAYSLTDQIRRSSRSVCANLSEASRKRRYEAAFVSKLNDSETEAGETQVWLEFAVECEYVEPDEARDLYAALQRDHRHASGDDQSPGDVGHHTTAHRGQGS